ncbi:small-conductance mechanosensitive channel [Microbacterium proteolyticum]|uniref:Small-conductance mechanosensitive channel n=1 Tax=Microbacterium proteolyticum TaxID=1572644 RepID=A0A7W5CGY7_9MICO|nr:mechanosensitive ion channel family protein [Microbacterium proteolyticum]MBB3157498.1 small-conductance mechanosensitive channel [Microbacterium proteolyticum]
MPTVFDDTAIGWAIAAVVAVPILLIVLTEVVGILRRRRSPAVKPLLLLRNWVVPFGGLVGLLVFATRSEDDLAWPRVVATIFGFLLILLLLSALNVALFETAKRGSWRDRVPTIFIEIARLLLVVIGLGFLFQQVWDADVAGLITALGVTSIVIGLALQNAAGGIVSGLLVLFEQPFRQGDWIETGGSTGRVVEINWRALHIDTGSGLQIIPNSKLADASFLNLSRPPGPFTAIVSVTFAPTDAPHAVASVVRQVAADLPALVPGAEVSVTNAGAGAWEVAIPLDSPVYADAARSTFRSWLWYAARRRGLSLDKVAPDAAVAAAAMERALKEIPRLLPLDDDLRARVAEECRVEQYGSGEILLRAGQEPSSLMYVLDGRAVVSTVDGEIVAEPVASGDWIGTISLTRERSATTTTALSEIEVLVIPLSFAHHLMRASPRLAAELSADAELRRGASESR